MSSRRKLIKEDHEEFLLRGTPLCSVLERIMSEYLDLIMILIIGNKNPQRKQTSVIHLCLNRWNLCVAI